MKQAAELIAVHLLAALAATTARGQCCDTGCCYPSQPTRLVRPLVAESGPVAAGQPLSNAAHCRVRVGDGTLGSGALVARSTATALVLTCSHLFDSSTAEIVVEFPDNSRFAARLIERDAAHDLAALLIQRPTTAPLAIDPLDEQPPTGLLTACGYGGRGEFRAARGRVSGAAQIQGAQFPALRIASAVRPGDSGGAVLDPHGRLVGVVWGCRDGETYFTCGQPLGAFLRRVLPHVPSPADTTSAATKPIADAAPTLDPAAWREAIEARLAALDANKQDRGDYLQAGDLGAYVTRADFAESAAEQAAASAEQCARVDEAAVARCEAVRVALHQRFETLLASGTPSWLTTISRGSLLVAAIGVGGPLATAALFAVGALARRRARRTAAGAWPAARPIAVDTPPPAQQQVGESHYVTVERDSFARAHQWAREQVARKYPGSTEILATLESLIKQQLAGG